MVQDLPCNLLPSGLAYAWCKADLVTCYLVTCFLQVWGAHGARLDGGLSNVHASVGSSRPGVRMVRGELVVRREPHDGQSREHILNQNGLQVKSGFEMCFAIGSQHFGCRGSQPKHVSNPDSATKEFKPHFIYECVCVQAMACGLWYLSLCGTASTPRR